MRRRPNAQTVKFFLEADANGQLDLDPPYQRRSAWSDDWRRFFVDSVLRGYPCPAIYLDVETQVGSPTIYHVLDGKQRLLALIEFARDGFHLGDYMAERGLSKVYFSQLPDDLKQAFIDYELSVENLSATSEVELQQAFDRLNRNVARLNRMELRNAALDGEFITRMEDLSQHSFWLKTGVASRTNVRRMRDVEFVAELFLLTMHGVLEGSADLLDDYFAEYDEVIPDEDDHREAYDEVLDYLDDMELEWKKTRWRNLADLYSLWAALLILGAESELPDPGEAGDRLTSFSQALEDPSEGPERDYSDAVRQGQGKRENRQTRADILVDLLRE
ncbi:MAG: hypothetical protein QOD71_436 [Thermoleophilaceae bacterium]|jgi:hypothetical protein|nr:hypothetical protein [Thermoleophilaceae bacterium]